MSEVKKRKPMLKPNTAQIIYSDGSSKYHIHRALSVDTRDGHIIIKQQLPKRAKVSGHFTHVIPGHNVDVVIYRAKALKPEGGRLIRITRIRRGFLTRLWPRGMAALFRGN